MFVREYKKILSGIRDANVFVDLFGGSGLLSHITKCQRPDATVVYNDFDNYRFRLENIPRTNALLADLRDIVREVPKHGCVRGAIRDEVFARLEQEEREHGYIDFITISSALMFSMKYKQGIAEMKKKRLFTTISGSRTMPMLQIILKGLRLPPVTIRYCLSNIETLRVLCFLSIRLI